MRSSVASFACLIPEHAAGIVETVLAFDVTQSLQRLMSFRACTWCGRNIRPGKFQDVLTAAGRSARA